MFDLQGFERGSYTLGGQGLSGLGVIEIYEVGFHAIGGQPDRNYHRQLVISYGDIPQGF